MNGAGIALPPSWAPLLSAMENNGTVSAEWFYRLSCVGTSKETGAKLEHFRHRVKRGAAAMYSMRKIM